MLEPDADIRLLRGADYNPRVIDEDGIEALRESIRTIGIVKPIVASGDLIVAGHQRCRALLSLGVERAPVYRLPQGISPADEIIFNQLHNATDSDVGDENAVISGLGGLSGFVTVSPSRATVNMRSAKAMAREKLATMISRFGSWGCVVAVESGEVVHGGQYVIAAKAVRAPILVFVCPDSMRDDLARCLGRQYGEFSYDHLDRRTYMQTFAQPPRRRSDGGILSSPLYEKRVIPWLKKNPGARVLDFGSGYGAYPARLRRQGFKVFDIEFFRRVPGRGSIDFGEVKRMISTALADIEKNGLFDAVVCDVVLNSVDSKKAEDSVWTMLNALCRMGGRIFFSGRQRERMDAILAKDKVFATSTEAASIEFFDRDGFSARVSTASKGHWFYQRYHTKDEVVRLADFYGMELIEHDHGGGAHVGSLAFYCTAKKIREMDLTKIMGAVDFEFDMKVSEDRSVGMSQEARRVLGAVVR